MTWTERIEQYITVGLTVSGGKGDSTAKSAEKATAAFQKTLQTSFASQFGKQSNVLNFLNNRFMSGVENPTGFTPQTKAALNTNAIQTTAGQFQNALKGAQEREAAQGGNGLPSGVQAQITGQLEGQAASQLSGELNQNTLEDAQQQQRNYWANVSGLSGVASQFDPLGYAGGSNSASAGIADLSNANTNANANSFTGALSKGFGSALGNTLGGGNAGGPSGGAKGFFGV